MPFSPEKVIDEAMAADEEGLVDMLVTFAREYIYVVSRCARTTTSLRICSATARSQGYRRMMTCSLVHMQKALEAHRMAWTSQLWGLRVDRGDCALA